MKNLFKKSSLWKLIAAVFAFSFYARIAEAKGSGFANFFGILVSVVLMVVAVVVFPVGIPLLLGYTGLQLSAVAIGQIQCQAGQSNIFFTGCSSQESSGGGTQQAGTSGSPVLLNEVDVISKNE